ncbi:MAG: CDP-alcohol phosphatidyltransferase family protein [Acidobacteriota bacterium]
MKKLFKEFKNSLKDIAVEEAVDLFLFRPVSFIFTKFLVKIPITPNQISLLSLISGIVSGIFFSYGDKKSFVYGGLFFILCHIFDLLDGMIARLKKNGTPLGRIIDGWVDYITSIAVYLGFLLGLLKGNFDLPFGPWPLMIAASVSLAVHSMAVDYYRQQYLAFALGKNKTIGEDLRIFHRRYESIKKKRGNYVEKILLFVYFGYTKLQVTGTFDKKKYKNEDYCSCNRTLLVFWNMIGVSTHRFFMVLAAIFYNPMIFFWYILVFANLWMAVLAIIQWRVDKNAASAKRG